LQACLCASSSTSIRCVASSTPLTEAAPRLRRQNVNEHNSAARVACGEARTLRPRPRAPRHASHTRVRTAQAPRQPRRTPRGAAAQPRSKWKRTPVAPVLPASTRAQRQPPRPAPRSVLPRGSRRVPRRLHRGARAKLQQVAAYAAKWNYAGSIAGALRACCSFR
jgi:hypothetical protein